MVRAVSILTGYWIQGKGATNCALTYLAQVDPKGTDAAGRQCRKA